MIPKLGTRPRCNHPKLVEMCGLSPLLHVLHLLLINLVILPLKVAASRASNLSNRDDRTLADPQPTNGGNAGGNAQSTDSDDIIGSQPVTAQLGAGFIVGCVVGIMLYGVTRISLKLWQGTVVPRRVRRARRRETERQEAVIVDV